MIWQTSTLYCFVESFRGSRQFCPPSGLGKQDLPGGNAPRTPSSESGFPLRPLREIFRAWAAALPHYVLCLCGFVAVLRAQCLTDRRTRSSCSTALQCPSTAHGAQAKAQVCSTRQHSMSSTMSSTVERRLQRSSNRCGLSAGAEACRSHVIFSSNSASLKGASG